MSALFAKNVDNKYFLKQYTHQTMIIYRYLPNKVSCDFFKVSKLPLSLCIQIEERYCLPLASYKPDDKKKIKLKKMTTYIFLLII